MKMFILLSTILLSACASQVPQKSYDEFVAKNPDIKKFEIVNGISFKEKMNKELKFNTLSINCFDKSCHRDNLAVGQMAQNFEPFPVNFYGIKNPPYEVARIEKFTTDNPSQSIHVPVLLIDSADRNIKPVIHNDEAQVPERFWMSFQTKDNYDLIKKALNSQLGVPEVNEDNRHEEHLAWGFTKDGKYKKVVDLVYFDNHGYLNWISPVKVYSIKD